jgi:CRISPR/Cas system-associated endonuclease Cas1
MKKSLYVYNNGDLKRKDNTLRFTPYESEPRDIPIERISDIYCKSQYKNAQKVENKNVHFTPAIPLPELL